MRNSVYQYCIENGREDLLQEWDNGGNLPLRPKNVRAETAKAIWWCCENGHRWQAGVKTRLEGAGQCPFCRKEQHVEPTCHWTLRYPEIAAQWDTEQNGGIQPEQVRVSGRQKYWWRCEKGHQWAALFRARTTGGSSCPYCAQRRVLAGYNDLGTKFPEIAKQWDYEKNAPLTPQETMAYSNRKVWWRCELGHSYAATVKNRTGKHTGCPYCTRRSVLPGFNDLASQHPELVAQWHPFMNGTLTPEQVTYGSKRRVWWQCPEGHVWRAVIYSRTGTRPSGCPLCAKQMAVWERLKMLHSR